MKTGDSLGPWKLTSRLGRGGNAEVWNVANSEGQTAAIKVLRSDRQSRDRLARFKDEIKFLQRPNPHPGVLPILDAHLSNTDSDPPWLVMPVANTLRASLGDSPPLTAVVRAIAEIAETLAALAADGIGHRDIKPENLYELNGRFLVGDFGLITYPDKDPMTRSGRRLGPIDFMAPEMRDAADEAAAEPADAYALAKTFWVLAVNRELPLPGTHRVDDAAYSLVSNLTGDHLATLDLLLERATRTMPADRVSLHEFASELRSWLGMSKSKRSAMPDVKELTTRLSAAVQPAVKAEEHQGHLNRAANAGFEELRDGALREVMEQFQEIKGGNAGWGTRSDIPTPFFSPPMVRRREMHRNAWSAMLGIPGPRSLQLVCIAGLQLFNDETARFGAAYVLGIDGDWVTLWKNAKEIHCGSAAQAIAIAELGDAIRHQFVPCLQSLSKRVENSGRI